FPEWKRRHAVHYAGCVFRHDRPVQVGTFAAGCWAGLRQHIARARKGDPGQGQYVKADPGDGRFWLLATLEEPLEGAASLPPAGARGRREDAPRRPGGPSGGRPTPSRRPGAPPRRAGIPGERCGRWEVVSALKVRVPGPILDYLKSRGLDPELRQQTRSDWV